MLNEFLSARFVDVRREVLQFFRVSNNVDLENFHAVGEKRMNRLEFAAGIEKYSGVFRRRRRSGCGLAMIGILRSAQSLEA
jgi:hypothetical protein